MLARPIFAFYLDLRKAYDTVWRDALLYKLWNNGVQGKMWRYILNMYSRTDRAVRCGDTTSHKFQVDLGTAQGDTLSCIIFDIYVDDLLREVDSGCPGVPLPVAEEPQPTNTAASTEAAEGSPQPAGATLTALMYKLWNKGVRGKMWRYIHNMYSRTDRAVRCGDTTSHKFPVDLGTAQGDTLSCIIFDIYVDDLLREVDNACPGVPLPMAEAAEPTGTAGTADADMGSPQPAATPAELTALMFADDFTGIATTAAGLQQIIGICERWCAKWRMAANIGPKKSAYMVFAPEEASKNDKNTQPRWQGTPIPRVEAYRYLGVMLHENCRWDCHLAHAREKGAKATYAMASVLHNRRIHTAVRRIVLQACVRPVVEYLRLNCVAWHPR